VLSEESLLLFFDGLSLEGLDIGSFPSFLVFDLALHPIYLEFLLPQLLDVSLVLQLPHSSFLGIHLLQPLVLGELLGHLNLELFFHLTFLFQSYSLKLELIILSSLQFFLHSQLAGSHFLLASSESFFHFLYLEIVSKILHVFLVFTSLPLFQRKLVEYCLSLCLSLHFHLLQIIRSLLLLGGVLSHELFLILFKLLLPLEESLLFIDREDHILFTLLLFHFVNSNHFMILFDHLIDDLVDV